MKKLVGILSLLALVLLPCGSLFAFELGKLQLNGFASQGYIDSSKNNWLIEDTKSGNAELTELGLTMNLPLADNLRFGAQLLSRDFGESGNMNLQLDWASLDYRPADWFGVRLGKVKIPVGLYNQERDADFARTMSYLPQSIYPEEYRDIMNAGIGGSIYGNIPLGSAGDVDYQFFTGNIELRDDSYAFDILEYPLTEAGVTILDNDYETDYNYAANLVYNPPVDGLRFGFSRSVFKGAYETDISYMFPVFPPFPGPPMIMPFGVKADTDAKQTMHIASVEYVTEAVNARFEYAQIKTEIDFNNFGPLQAFLPNTKNTSEAYYLAVDVPVKMVKGLTVGCTFDTFYADKGDRDGSELEDSGRGDDSEAWQRDLGFGVRYDINDNWLIKAEWHTVDGTALVKDYLNPDDIEDNWDYFIIKTTVVF